MNYRVRKQAITGKLVLQNFSTLSDQWRDATHPPKSEEFIAVDRHGFEEMEARIARYERRAEGQRKANAARRAAAQQPQEQT